MLTDINTDFGEKNCNGKGLTIVKFVVCMPGDENHGVQ